MPTLVDRIFFGASVYTSDCSLIGNAIFQFNSDSLISNRDQISSDPTRVCYCLNNIPQCTDPTYLMLNETRHPGETFNTSVVLTGYYFGRVAGSVHTGILHQDSSRIEESAHSSSECFVFQSLLFSYRSMMLVLTAQPHSIDERSAAELEANIKNAYSRSYNDSVHCTTLLTTPVYINVTMEACPLGFELNNLTRACECEQIFFSDVRNMNITCNIQDHIGYIYKAGTLWVGMDTNTNNTDTFYWQKNCPNSFCNVSSSITLEFPDEQCRPHLLAFCVGVVKQTTA